MAFSDTSRSASLTTLMTTCCVSAPPGENNRVPDAAPYRPGAVALPSTVVYATDVGTAGSAARVTAKSSVAPGPSVTDASVTVSPGGSESMIDPVAIPSVIVPLTASAVTDANRAVHTLSTTLAGTQNSGSGAAWAGVVLTTAGIARATPMTAAVRVGLTRMYSVRSPEGLR